MKHYFQNDGGALKRTALTASGRICECCDGLLHAAFDEHTALEDDVECSRCGALCSCECHRKNDNRDPIPTEDSNEVD